MKNKSILTCSYLYADGHAVLKFERDVMIAGKRTVVEYAEIHEKFTDACLNFKGRLCFSRYGGAAILKLARQSTHIDASAPSTESGSENTRKLGLAVGNLSFNFPDGSYLSWISIPDLISGSFTFQPYNDDKFEDGLSSWGTCNTVIYKHAKKPMAMAA